MDKDEFDDRFEAEDMHFFSILFFFLHEIFFLFKIFLFFNTPSKRRIDLYVVLTKTGSKHRKQGIEQKLKNTLKVLGF